MVLPFGLFLSSKTDSSSFSKVGFGVRVALKLNWHKISSRKSDKH